MSAESEATTDRMQWAGLIRRSRTARTAPPLPPLFEYFAPRIKILHAAFWRQRGESRGIGAGDHAGSLAEGGIV